MKVILKKIVLKLFGIFTRFTKIPNGYYIFMYHRIVNKRTFNEKHVNSLFVTEEEFSKQIKFFKNNFVNIDLNTLRQHIINNTKPNRPYFSLTFDDGYEDNFKYVAPMLVKQKLYGTFFLCTGFIKHKIHKPWWDKIFDIIKNCNEKIEIHLSNKKIIFDLSKIKEKTKFNNFCSRHLQFFSKQKQEFFFKNNNLVKFIDKGNEFSDWRMIKNFSKSKFISFGGHTVWHPSLGKINKSFKEIEHNKKEIEKKINKSISCFAYPYGGVKDISQEAEDKIKVSGFMSAVTTKQIINSEKTDIYKLGRIEIFNHSTNDIRANLFFAKIRNLFYEN